VVVAIRWSHVPNKLRPSNRPRLRQALTSVSLDGVLGVVEGAEHAVAVEPHPLAVRGGELVEGTAVATRGGVDQFGFGGHVSSPSPIRHARSSDVIGRGS